MKRRKHYENKRIKRTEERVTPIKADRGNPTHI